MVLHNQINLIPIVPLISAYLKDSDSRFLIVSDENIFPNVNNVIFCKWSLEKHFIFLNEIDIGIMPLDDNAWNRGKSCFKLLEYMFMSIPSIASPVGINRDIIDHGRNGFLAYSPYEFIQYIDLLLNDQHMYQKIQQNSRTSVLNSFSVKNNYKKLRSVLLD